MKTVTVLVEVNVLLSDDLWEEYHKQPENFLISFTEKGIDLMRKGYRDNPVGWVQSIKTLPPKEDTNKTKFIPENKNEVKYINEKSGLLYIFENQKKAAEYMTEHGGCWKSV